MNTNTFCVEAFVDYCDSYQIANEGFIKTIKEKIVRGFKRLLEIIREKISKMRDGKIKSLLMKIFRMSKEGLNKAERLNPSSPSAQKEVKDLQEQLQENTKELQEIQKMSRENSENLDKAIKNTKEALDDVNKIRNHVKKNNVDPELKDSMDAARKNGVPEEKILKNKKDVDEYFTGEKKDEESKKLSDEETKKIKQKFLDYALSNQIAKTAYDEFKNSVPFSLVEEMLDELGDLELPRKQTTKANITIGEMNSYLSKVCETISLCVNGTGKASEVNRYYTDYDHNMGLFKKYTKKAKEEIDKLKNLK